MTKCIVAVSFLSFLFIAVAAAQPRPRLLATTVKQDKDTTVTIRHVGDTFDIGSVETPPPILVIVRHKGRDYPQMTLTGSKDFPPWGVRAAFARDLNGDGRQEIVIGSYCHFGGSGGVRYMTILSGVGAAARLYTLPRGESENIHDSTFYLLKGPNGKPGIAITHPTMDGSSRADATRWRVSSFRLSVPRAGEAGEAKAIPLSEKRTTKRYSERLPDSAAAQHLPAGWKIVVPLL
ncbi:MAG: hypothetical protein V4671_25905 [Armatimonadota bacterium]